MNVLIACEESQRVCIELRRSKFKWVKILWIQM